MTLGADTVGRSWVAIVGPNSSGKSTLAETLAARPNLAVVREPVPGDELQELERPSGASNAGYRLQRAFISARFEAASSSQPGRLLVFDRCLAEDREVFFKLHRDALGDITNGEMAELSAQCLGYEAVFGRAKCFIELRANPATLERRMLEGGRPQWLLTTLTAQLALYDRWLSGDATPRLVIDTDQASQTMAQEVSVTLLDAVASAMDPRESILKAAHTAPEGVSYVLPTREPGPTILTSDTSTRISQAE